MALFGSGGGHGVDARKRKAWSEVAEKVAEVGNPYGINRGGAEDIRRKWSDLAYRAKQYLKRRNGKNVTGEYEIKTEYTLYIYICFF